MRRSESLIALVSLVLFLNSGIAYSQGPIEPTPQHKAMAREVGEWEAKAKMWMAPDGEPMETKATEKCSMLGGFWLMTEYKSEIAGIAYKGMGTLGYDPFAKKYIGNWVDSMSPILSTMEGDYDVETHTLTMMSTARNPMTGETQTSKLITRYVGNDTKEFELHAPVPGKEGEYWKQMEVVYKRVK